MTLRILKVFLFVLSACPVLSLSAQSERDVPVRTPEQEAVSQTQKLREALSLSDTQTRLVYLINLHYAKERQASNSRAEALERVKRKNADLRKVLTEEQYYRLQNKHYERSSRHSARPTVPTAYPSSSSGGRQASPRVVSPAPLPADSSPTPPAGSHPGSGFVISIKRNAATGR